MNDSSMAVHGMSTDSGTSSEELSRMGDVIAKLGWGPAQAVQEDQETCLRFLMEHSMDATKAAKKYVKYRKWREDYLPLGYIPDDEVRILLDQGIIALQGLSKKGWPVLVGFACKHQPSKHDGEMFKRFVTYTMEKIVASAPESKRGIVITDFNNYSLKSLDPKFFLTAFGIQQNYYPGIMAKLYMVNAPKFFSNAWKLISTILTKSNRERVVFLEASDMTEVLLSEMDAHVLPKLYGGKADIKLVQNVGSSNWG